MRMAINYSSQDIKSIQAVVSDNRYKTFFRQRVSRNVDGDVPQITREIYWQTMVMCLLTTQQRSGPTSRISRFLFENPFRLSLKACQHETDLEVFVRRELENYGGIRFGPKIASQMNINLVALSKGGWKALEQHSIGLIQQRKSRPNPDNYHLERDAAYFVERNFKGFGPKQSRNFWQSLGLTRYEFVLDSRVLKWLRGKKFPIPLSSMALGEEEYYCFVSDILREWCAQAEVFPCLFDAAIFSSFDHEEWPEETPVY
jgi:hypothetical protein